MGNLALAPAAVAFPVVFCLTYFLCVGPRRAISLTLAGVVPLAAVATWLETGGTRSTCGASCLGLKDVAPVVWWLALSWVLAVAAGTAVRRAGATPWPGVSRSLEQPPRSPAPDAPREPPGSADDQEERAAHDRGEERAAPDHGDHAEGVVGRALEGVRDAPEARPRCRGRCRARARSARMRLAAASREHPGARLRAPSGSPRGVPRASPDPRPSASGRAAWP